MHGVMTITLCPSCGGNKLKRVRRDFTAQFRGEAYTVPDLEFHECPDCGEKIYDRQAMRKVEACSPAFAKSHLVNR